MLDFIVLFFAYQQKSNLVNKRGNLSFKADNLIFPDKDAGEFLRYYSRSPSQHLKGHWLEAAGFGTETVEHGQLLIRIVAE
ncbi:SymE family type I addiction module toxin [Brenneria goodwinii]|uniref:SymE family type I addiction module toxin n=1 Tax=Brenneria goodwinii TaxID=1109412 RepID=UPI001EFAAA16|nr:SymE family type I addiction module toxin [Brenneria goodwinii]